MTQTGVPEILPSAPYKVPRMDPEPLFELMQKYFEEHTPIEVYDQIEKTKFCYVMGFVDEKPIRVLNSKCNVFVTIRGIGYPACNVRPKMTVFREADEEGYEYFIERNNHPGMTHKEMLDVGKKALKESEDALAKLKDLESFTHRYYEEIKQHEQLIEIWKKTIKWNQDAIDKGNY